MNTNANHFSGLASKVQEVPQNQRTGVLIEGICQTMKQQSGNLSPEELSGELRAAEPQLIKACQA